MKAKIISYITIILSISACGPMNDSYYDGRGGYNNGGYYGNGNRSGGYHGNEYDDPYYNGSGSGWGHRREHRELERERRRLEDERRRLEDERRRDGGGNVFIPAQPVIPPAPQIREHCPSGWTTGDWRCSAEERRKGCKDMRMPSGTTCYKR